MNNKFKIDVGDKYNIYVEEDFSFIYSYIIENKIDIKSICIITDDNVSSIYLNDIKKIFIKSRIIEYIIKPGERSKNLDQVNEIYKFLLLNKVNRQTLIIALGGGVVGDIAGFVSATYMRGINLVQIPTSLLSQVDSSIGGKVGVDFLDKKNIIGSFYNPKFVYININTLKTLPEQEFNQGMSEVIKHAYILDHNYLNFLVNKKENIKNYDKNVLKEMIYTSCKIKSNIVFLDEKEIGIRQILNFGHTFGHAIETASNFNILHGEAVAIGIVASLYISLKYKYICRKTLEEAKNLLKYFKIYFKNRNIKVEDIYNNMIYDKKNKNGKINIIIIEKIGKAFSTDKINEREIKLAIKYALEG